MTPPGVVALIGDWTIYRAVELRQNLMAHLEAGACCFDLAGIHELDSAGLQLLLSLRVSARGLSTEVRLCNPSVAVLEVFATCGLEAMLEHGLTARARA